MHRIYFKLPINVARSAFRDVIDKFLKNVSEDPDPPKYTIGLTILERPTAERKHVGHGHLDFEDEKIMDMFLARLKVEPIMLNSEVVTFSREPLNDSPSGSQQPPSSTPQTTVTPPREQRSKPPPSERPASNGSELPRRAFGSKMNLNRTKHLQHEKREVKPPNIIYQRKLQHRLSLLGQHARLEKLEFGVLRNWNFSIEYSRSLIEETGYLIFEDDEKSLRVTIGGSHQDSVMPSVAISIQTVNYVALGTDFSKAYMFLALSQNPHFERGEVFRESTGSAKDDARRSRTRHSALDESHKRVAPFASRWIKLTFHQDSHRPNAKLCEMAGLPTVQMDPPLTFNKQDRYSRRYTDAVLKWVQGGSMPWEVAFQCEALFRNGTLVPQELLAIKPIVEELVTKSSERAADALKTFRGEIEGAGARRTFNDFENQNVVEAFKEHINNNQKSTPLNRLRTGVSKSNFMCHHVKITPTAVHFNGPLAEQSNRVIRRYPGFESYFIRVSFTDEADGHTRFEHEVDIQAFTHGRIGGFLKNKLQVGNRQYELLGYSQSGFREHACFFSAPFIFEGQEITASFIRESLGNFDKVINCPARYGARMSQAFSSTNPSIVLQESYIKHVPDLKTTRSNQEFSDGCGTISRQLAEEAWKSMIEQMPQTRRRQRHKNEPIPCAFQIRIGGSKGVVRVDPKLEGQVLRLRPSMTKFEAPGEFSLEIARAFSGYSPCFLNRPLVMLLWTGGVDDSVFEKLMADSLETTTSGMTTFLGAGQQMISNRLGGPFRLASTFYKLCRLGLELDQPGVRTSGLHKILNATLYHIKRDLKHKARIKVPESYTLVGVCDEDNYLRPRQIYACVQHFDHKTGKAETRYLKGRILVTRSPVIHPGDAQILYAIGEPPENSPFAGEGNNLPNCVVFASCGYRPVPNMLGGGDLDGDLYNLITLPELVPPHIYAPAEYPPARLKKIDGRSTIEDVANFMVEFICNDALGMIAINHLVIASSADLRARDENCMVNAELHSKAVDFVKTGYYVLNHEIRKPRYDKSTDEQTGLGRKPDWQAGHGRDHTDGRYYECPSVLGRLFRAVELPLGNPARESNVEEQVPKAIQICIAKHVSRYKEEIQEPLGKCDTQIQALFLRYVAELNHICAAHTIASESSERVSEVEVMLGTNLEVNSKQDLIERMKRLTGDLSEFVRGEFQGSEDDSPYNWLARAWRAYLLTSGIGDKTFGALSFSWLALDSVLDALQTINEQFLPDAGPILPPFSSIPSTAPEPSESDQQIDLDNWAWDDAPEGAEEKDGEANKETNSNGTERHRNGSGRRNQNGSNRRHPNRQGSSSNGRVNSNGSGNGANRGPSRNSSNGGQQSNSSGNNRGQTNGTRGPRGRKPIFTITASPT